MQNKAKKSTRRGNDLVTELLLQHAFFIIFASRKGSKTMQYNAVNKHVTLICVFLIKQALLPSVTL